MLVKDILATAVVHSLESDDDVPIAIVCDLVMYEHVDDMNKDFPVEEIESAVMERYEGEVPENVDKFLDKLSGDGPVAELDWL